MISIITPSVRKPGLDVVLLALKRQTYKDWEWLIGSPFDPEIKEARWVVDDFEGLTWTFNRISNKLLKEAQGDLIVSWQDYTFADPDALEKFANHYELDKTALVSGVGNKYTSVYPQLGEQVWSDPRINNKYGSFYECYPADWEANFAMAPKQAFYDIGGYDEYLDNHFSMDNISVVDRIDDLNKYKFCLDQTIRSYSLVHGRPKDWDAKHAMHGAYNERKKYLKDNNVKLDYLNN